MKVSIKKLIVVLALGVVSAFAFTGCDAKDFLEEKINQARCEHEFGDVVTVEDSTCTKAGYGEKTCPKCNKVEKVDFEIKEHIPIVVDSVPSTCTKQGLTSGTKCADCGVDIVAQKTLAALGHKVITVKGAPATCLASGVSDGEYCERCSEVLKEQVKIPASGHNLVNQSAVEPTCTEDGKTHGVICDSCNTIFVHQECVPMLGHNVVDGLCTDCGGEFATPYISYKESPLSTSVIGQESVFRIYKNAYDSFTDGGDGIYIVVDFMWTDFDGVEVSKRMYLGLALDGEISFTFSNEPCTLLKVEDLEHTIEWFETDEYYDIVLQADDIIVIDSDLLGGTLNGTYKISLDSTVSGFNDVIKLEE